MGISALCARLAASALGAVTTLQPWGRNTSELGEDSEELVDAQEILLPLPDAIVAILVEDNGTGVFTMADTTDSGLSIRFRVEEPISSENVAKLGLIPGQMCLHPCDSGQLVLLREDALP